VSWQDLDRASRLLALHLTEAVQRFGPSALDVIDLPPLTGGSIEPGQLRAAAALFWAMEVDVAGVIDFVDTLAEGMRLGRFALDLGRAEPLLMEWHRERAQRLSADERHALYDRLFGAEEVRQLFDQLVGQLSRIYTLEGPTPHLLADIGISGEELATALSARSAGITAFAAREIVDTIREALNILNNPDLLAAFGGRRSPVDLLTAAGMSVVGRQLDPGQRFDQARAGQQILSWLADNANRFEGGVVRIGPSDAVVHAANGWEALAPAAPAAPAVRPTA
jgi:hypothetical protein